jgi:hypothetical protein
VTDPVRRPRRLASSATAAAFLLAMAPLACVPRPQPDPCCSPPCACGVEPESMCADACALRGASACKNPGCSCAVDPALRTAVAADASSSR